MSTLKTSATKASVSDFLEKVEPETRRLDGKRLLKLFEEETGESAILWGPSIIGFGSYWYSYPDGKTLDWFPVGYSPRKQSLSIYLMRSHEDMKDELDKLGKYKTGKSCIYINKLADIDEKVLRKMIADTYHQHTKK